MLKGHYKDVFPKMIPARNWDPQRPSQPTIALPCPKQSASSKKPKLVLAGMILSATPNSTEWTLGVPGGDGSTAPTIVAVAQDPTYGNQSMNVNISDSLVGLPCTGNFRICTPFFKRGVPYPVGTPLTYATDAEINADLESYQAQGKSDDTLFTMYGAVRPAEGDDVVIGYVVKSQADKFYGVKNYDDPSTGGVNSSSSSAVNEQAFAMRKSINEAVCSLAMSENSYFIEYDTAFQPKATPSAVVSK